MYEIEKATVVCCKKANTIKKPTGLRKWTDYKAKAPPVSTEKALGRDGQSQKLEFGGFNNELNRASSHKFIDIGTVGKTHMTR